MGISRRISTVPRGFEPSKTWVLLAHRKGIKVPRRAMEWTEEGLVPSSTLVNVPAPAIFSIFRPQAIEYVVKGAETKEELERLAKRGLTPVHVRNRVP